MPYYLQGRGGGKPHTASFRVVTVAVVCKEYGEQGACVELTPFSKEPLGSLTEWGIPDPQPGGFTHWLNTSAAPGHGASLRYGRRTCDLPVGSAYGPFRQHIETGSCPGNPVDLLSSRSDGAV